MLLLIEQLENHIPEGDFLATKISAVPVKWHIDHSLKVINSVITALRDSNPANYQWKFNVKRTLVFWKGGIPRGVGKVPKSVTPPKDISVADLTVQLIVAKRLAAELSTITPRNNFKHPLFGILNTKQTLKFLNIHTRHHINIIEDILKHQTLQQQQKN